MHSAHNPNKYNADVSSNIVHNSLVMLEITGLVRDKLSPNLREPGLLESTDKEYTGLVILRKEMYDIRTDVDDPEGKGNVFEVVGPRSYFESLGYQLQLQVDTGQVPESPR